MKICSCGAERAPHLSLSPSSIACRKVANPRCPPSRTSRGLDELALATGRGHAPAIPPRERTAPEPKVVPSAEGSAVPPFTVANAQVCGPRGSRPDQAQHHRRKSQNQNGSRLHGSPLQYRFPRELAINTPMLQSKFLDCLAYFSAPLAMNADRWCRWTKISFPMRARLIDEACSA